MARLANISLSLGLSLKSLVLVCTIFYGLFGPVRAEASLGSFVSSIFASNTEAADIHSNERTINSQNVALLSAVASAKPTTDLTSFMDVIVDHFALMAAAGPMGTMVDVDEFAVGGADTISVYVVRSGDTLYGIAKMYGVSVNTILWSNDISSTKKLKIGQELVILPVTGIKYTVKKGDTIAGIAKEYKGDVNEILQFNDIEKLVVGDEIIIPNGEVAPAPASPKIKVLPNIIPTYINDAIDSLIYYTRPVVNGRKTQGSHGKNGIDIAPTCKCVGKEPLLAAASGTVIIARTGSWNGGYGNYVVISHPNGTQTLYGHMYSKLLVSPGERVDKGQQIGYVGSSGNSTGPHVHFEIRGATNPF